MKYRYGSHTAYDIKYYFVWVTKYRYQVLKGVVSKDHVHILVSAPPTMAPSEIIRRIKGRASKRSGIQQVVGRVPVAQETLLG